MSATPTELAFHQRMLALESNRLAFEELSYWLYDTLVRETLERVRHDAMRKGISPNPDLVEEAVGSALLEYKANPQNYDPAGKSLKEYLILVALSDYRNALMKEVKYQQHLLPLEAAENDLGDEQEIKRIIAELDVASYRTKVEALFDNDIDRKIAYLIFDREYTTARCEALLSGMNIPPEERKKEAYQVKRRVIERLRRWMKGANNE